MRSSIGYPSMLAALAVAAGLVRVPPAHAQSPLIALRTNGSIMRPGDCLRVEALALDYVAGPLAARVTYRYDQPVVVRDKDGGESTASRSVEIQRPVGPTVDALVRFQTLLLDDTFCVGQGSAPGPYQVEVALLAGTSGPPFGVLTTCAVFDNGGSHQAGGRSGCGFLVRSVTRVDPPDIVVFDAELPASGLYRAALFRGGALSALLDVGVSQTGPHELTIVSPELGRADGSTVDLVIFDQVRGASSTAARLSLPRKN